MPPWLSATVLAAVAALGLWGMWRGWQARGRRTAALVPTVPDVPEGVSTPPDAVEATYVSSTRAGDWLDRVVAHGLGLRTAALVSVHPAGVLVARSKAPDVWVPADALRAVGTSRGQAGKFVGRDELVVLTWVPDASTGVALDTALLVRHDAERPALLAAAGALVAPTDTDSAPQAREEQP